MMDEKTALTTTTTKKGKKGYIPLVAFMFTALLLVLGSYAGQMRGSSSSLPSSGDTCAAGGGSCAATSCCYGDCLAIGNINVCECLPNWKNGCRSNYECCSGRCMHDGTCNSF